MVNITECFRVSIKLVIRPFEPACRRRLPIWVSIEMERIMKRILLVAAAALLLCGAIGGQANATARREPHATHRVVKAATSIPRVGSFIDPDTGLHCYNTGWASICDGGVAGGDEAPSPAVDNNDWAAQQEQSAMDAANAGYAQDAATAAANVAAAATFDAQMTVGN